MNGLHKGSTFTIRADWIDEIDQGDRPAFRMLVPRYATKLRIGELLERASAHEAPSLPSDDDADSIATYRRDLSIAETVADELFGEYVTILDEHLVAWENVADVSGNPIAREGHGVADALDEIGVVALLMLFRGGSMLSNHEKKTSASPSPSPTAGRAEDAKKGAPQSAPDTSPPISSAPPAPEPAACVACATAETSSVTSAAASPASVAGAAGKAATP